MAHANSDASHTSASSALGITRGNDRTQSSLNTHSGRNFYSWFRPGPIQANSSTKVVEWATYTNNYKLGDFRNYDDAAKTPHIQSNFSHNYGGTSDFVIGFVINIEQVNIYELSGGSDVYYKIRAYLSSAARAARTPLHGSAFSVLVPRTTTTIPTGHSNNQTYKQSAAVHYPPTLNVTCQYSGLSTPTDIVYYDVYLANLSDTVEYMRFGFSYVNVTVTQLSAPYHSKTGPNVSGAPSGYTVVIPVVVTGSSDYAGADQAYTNGDTTYDTWWYLAGLKGSTWYRLGTVSCVATITGLGSTTTILNGALTTAGASSNEHDTGTLASSAQWNTGEVGELNAVVSSWTGFTEHALAGPPV